MKLLHVADLHLEHSWFDWVATHSVDYDLLVLAGDLQNAFSNSGMHDQVRAVTQWLLALATPTVLCSGNHDYWTSNPRGPVDGLAEAAWLTNLRGRKPIIEVDGDVIVWPHLGKEEMTEPFARRHRVDDGVRRHQLGREGREQGEALRTKTL